MHRFIFTKPHAVSVTQPLQGHQPYLIDNDQTRRQKAIVAPRDDY